MTPSASSTEAACQVNSTEGVYTALVALVSLLTFSTVISFMTSLIGTLQHKRMEEQLGEQWDMMMGHDGNRELSFSDLISKLSEQNFSVAQSIYLGSRMPQIQAMAL